MDNNYLLVVDGSALLVTSYYATLPREIMFEKDPEKQKAFFDKLLHTSDGTYINAVYTMLKLIKDILDKQNPAYIAFCFDKSRHTTFRKQIYNDYKGNRSDVPIPLKKQFILIEEILEKLGFKVFFGDLYEADDYAGTIAKKFKDDIPVKLLTKDHDYLQLADDNTRIWMMQSKQELADDLFDKYYSIYGVDKEDINLPNKVFEFTKDTIKEEFGVYPNQIADLKGIGGDTSDNIKGCRGVSADTGIVLLNEYGTVENLYETIESCNDKELKELSDFLKTGLGLKRSPMNMLIKENAKEDVYLSKKLATIVTDIPLDITLNDLSVNIDKELWNKTMLEYEMKSIVY